MWICPMRPIFKKKSGDIGRLDKWTNRHPGNSRFEIGLAQFRVILGLLSCLTRGRTPLRTVRFLAEAATDDEVLLQVCGVLDQGRCDEPRVAIRLGENTEVLFDRCF